MRTPRIAAFTFMVLAGWAGRAAAQQADDTPVDIEVPAVIMENPEGGGTETTDEALDLANVVQSAAKGVTTVQEAPVIVTVITADEIRDRNFQTLDQILDTVPGYGREGFIHGQFPSVTVRGTVQAVQLLHDSVSMFDPFLNVATFSRLQPIETIKRIEAITGPGGVLWGANSFLGVVNVITKDAEDVDGVEVGGQIGDGNGDRRNARVYLMAGAPDLAHGKAKVFFHAAFETWKGAALEMPLHMFSAPLPQPNSPDFYGPLTTADPPQSYMFTAFAKVTFGKLQLRFQVPFAERHTPLGFPGFVVRQTLPEDADPACQTGTDFVVPGHCVDAGKRSRDNEVDFFDRYAVAEFKTRGAGGKAGIDFKAYGVQFVRYFPHLGVLAPIPTLLEGGLAFTFNATSYRTGASFEGDFELPKDLRIQYGVEAFREFAINNTTTSRQGPGIQSEFIGPYDLTKLPLGCPLEPNTSTPEPNDVQVVGTGTEHGCPLTFAFPSSRSVGGVYLNPQWRPTKKLILDAGARLQIAPENLGEYGYPLTRLFSGTAVWNFIPNWHLKLNFAQGFRPPVFNNISSNGEAVQLDGAPDLRVETSDAAQAELNARIFKGERRIRELSFRLDYSYTLLHNPIQIISGHYVNAADRGLNSAEALAKLYIQGGHRLELSYTFLRVATRDKGLIKSNPEHSFHLAGIFNLVDGKLSAFSDLRVVGAIEDPDRLIDYRDMAYCQNTTEGCMGVPFGTVVDTSTGAHSPLRSGPSEVVLDKLPAVADLSLGMTWTPSTKLTVRGTVMNAFNERYYQPDVFFDYEPRLEFLPNPAEDWRAYLSATYAY